MTLPVIHTAIPYDINRNLGKAYNDFMALMQPEHWVCFIDHDAMMSTSGWYTQLCNAINSVEDAGIIVACTNRIGCPWQKAVNAPSGHDIVAHRRYGLQRSEEYQSAVIDVTDRPPLSGVLMCLSVKTWKAMGGFKDGFLGIDNQAHRDAASIGKRIYLMPGLYVYHWYRERL